MDFETLMTKDNAIFFMDMVDSVKSPNFVPVLFKPRPYIKLLQNKGEDYQRFIGLYAMMKYILSEREVFVLDSIYGINKEKATFEEIGKMLNLSRSRIAHIRNDAEVKLVRELIWYFEIKR
ncbi:sigma factor-like helix-turn-helix DNA-binding protein [Neobacillus sp. PS2-9]|uniref:sigma factor-like helix-turn-helix DNA-binding protein n=1 Tax=Neobacillus sp. PS2-9 TaxID=3070676 RepID=UPI0027DFABDA|nr:sigma factor-like helix-turn-helix DNA-binding protein [Neobacillus sp. PS2-9]WML56661.1 sigma factor-like helix-turn-helix DNA-binding protein [Neobacillus sp. PS2-9]